VGVALVTAMFLKKASRKGSSGARKKGGSFCRERREKGERKGRLRAKTVGFKNRQLAQVSRGYETGRKRLQEASWESGMGKTRGLTRGPEIIVVPRIRYDGKKQHKTQATTGRIQAAETFIGDLGQERWTDAKVVAGHTDGNAEIQ